MNNFKAYKHSKAIIFSHLEKQYSFMIHEGKKYQILFTDFDYHYVTGIPPKDISELKSILREYINSNNKNEIILFEDDLKWRDYLNQLFKEINGVLDYRYSFKLNEGDFEDIIAKHTFKHDVTIRYVLDNHSNYEYPVAEIADNNKIVSFSKGFMIGKNHVEIDVFTDESYRRKDMAFEASLVLIDHLLGKGYIPCWNAWKVKESSHKLAQKCGFHLEQEVQAYIWVKDFGGF